MNEPKTPDDPPQDGASPASNPVGKTPQGVPLGAEEHEPKGTPSSDRHETETAPHKPAA